jgi:hypothetical protein
VEWHNKNTKYKCTEQMMNENLDDMHYTVQHNEFTEVRGDYRDPLMGHQDLC